MVLFHVLQALCLIILTEISNNLLDAQGKDHPSSRAFSYGTYALYLEKTLHESCQVLIEHAQRVAKIQFRIQAGSPFM